MFNQRSQLEIYHDQLEFEIIESDARSQNLKILNQKYQVVNDTTKHK